MQNQIDEQRVAAVFRPEFRLNAKEIQALWNMGDALYLEYRVHYPILDTWLKDYTEEKVRLREFDPSTHGGLTDDVIYTRFYRAIGFFFYSVTPALAIKIIEEAPALIIDLLTNWLINQSGQLENFDIRRSLICTVAIHASYALYLDNPDKRAVEMLKRLPIPEDVTQQLVDHMVGYFQNQPPRARPH